MIARDIMTTQVIMVQETATIKEALKLIIDLGLSGLVVTNAQQEVVGVLSERDILVAYDLLKEIKSPIEGFVKKKIYSVHPETPIEEISRLLVQLNIKRVPVMEGKKCVGVISRSDVLKYILKLSKV